MALIRSLLKLVVCPFPVPPSQTIHIPARITSSPHLDRPNRTPSSYLAMVYFPRTFIAEYRVARTLPLLSSAGWWVNRWPFLGLLETAVKLCAFLAAAYVPLDASSAPPATVLERAPFYAQTFLFFGGTVILSLAIFERVLLYRELISLAFVLPNIWAHFTVLAAMYRGRAAVSVFHFRVFLALMLAGDVVKLVFFAVHDFSMLNIARYVRGSSFLDHGMLQCSLRCFCLADWPDIFIAFVYVLRLSTCLSSVSLFYTPSFCCWTLATCIRSQPSAFKSASRSYPF